jgi:hypothetical protein
MPIVENIVTASGQQTLVNNTQVMSATSTGVAIVQVGPMTSATTPVTFAMSPYTVLSTDLVVLCATSGGAISVVLPTAASSTNRVVQVCDASGSAASNNITVSVSGGGTINGAASYVINSAYGSATFICTGGIWIVSTGGGGGGGGGGYATGVRQVVFAQTGTQASGSTQIPFDNTIPQITEGWEVMTATITPQSATSTLYVTGIVNCSASASSQCSVGMALFRDATANSIGGSYAINAIQYALIQITAQARVTSGSTSATTFRMRIGSNPGASPAATYTNGQQLVGQVFGGVAATTLMIMEVGA